MATFVLNDGTEVPEVTPHLGDQYDLTRALNVSMSDFQRSMHDPGFVMIFSLYASLHRADRKWTVERVMDIPIDEWRRVPDAHEDNDEDDERAEGEQSANPPGRESAAHRAAPNGPSATS